MERRDQVLSTSDEGRGGGGKTRVLFVDDDPQVLGVLKFTFGRTSQEWETAVASTGAAALAEMERSPFDIIVTDLRMPNMSGVQLLNEVMRRHPRCLRIMISGYGEHDLIMGSLGTAHQFVAKPFDLRSVRHVLMRLKHLDQALSEPLRCVLNGLVKMPSIPSIYVELIEALSSMDSPIEEVCSIVERDPALTAKLLQLVNSAFFGFAHEVSCVNEAVQYLGLGMIRSLAMGIHLFQAFDKVVFDQFSIERIWNHSLRVAVMSRRIVQCEQGAQELQEQAFTAGLLHDVGKMVLADNFTDRYGKVLERARARQQPTWVVEQEEFSATHADVAAYLFTAWGLPIGLTESVAFHHVPSKSPNVQFAALTAVHVANVLAESGRSESELDVAYLEKVGVRQKVAAWRELSLRGK